MNFNDIHPFVRYAQKNVVTSQKMNKLILAKDCRVFSHHGGHGYITTNGISFEMEENSLLIIPSGFPYMITSDSSHLLEMTVINFDYVQEILPNKHPIPTRIVEENIVNYTYSVSFSDYPILNEPIYIHTLPYTRQILNEMSYEYICKKLHFHQRLSGQMLMLLTEILRLLSAENITKINRTETINQIIEYIQTHYSEPISNEDIANYINYHPNYINRLVKSYTGQSLHQYLQSFRMRKALELLQSTTLPIYQIATELGFKDACHFSRCFKKIIGNKPSAYR